MGREEPSGVDSAAMFSISSAARVCVRVSYSVAGVAALMVRPFLCEYVCVSAIVSIWEVCVRVWSHFVYFSMHVCVLCVVSLGGLALHLHQLQRMVLTSIMTE